MGEVQGKGETAPLRIDDRGAIQVWTLDRPARMNALNRALMGALGDAATAVQQRSDIRAVVITGAGDRAFCAGADLVERRGMDEADVRRVLSEYTRVFGAIDRLDRPVVAAINGVALGGGLELALACDLRVMVAGASVGLPETSLAVIPGAGGTQRLPRIVGVPRAKEMVLLGQPMNGTAALESGLVNRVAASGQSALECALELAEPFQKAAPIALAAALEALDAALGLPLDAGLQLEHACYERTLGSRDRLEALAAFAEKRAPEFKGR